MVKKGKKKPKKRNNRNNSTPAKKANTKPNKQKERKFDVPSVTLPPNTTKQRFSENTVVSCPPFEVHAYSIPSALEAYQWQCRFGPTQQLPLILHSICSCLADEFENIEKNFDLDDKLLQKDRPFVPVRTPDLPQQLVRQLRSLTFGLFGNAHTGTSSRWVDIIMGIPGMRHIILEMDLQTTSVRECEDHEDLLPKYYIDRSMHHFGHTVCYINRRIIEMNHSVYSPLCVKRLIQLNNCRKTRFCLNCMLAEFLIELYSKDQYKKYFLENDLLPSLFMDLVDVPVLTDRILDFLFSLSERAWYEASEEMVFNAFELIFLPWVDGNLYLQTDMKEFQDDIQTLLWHVMSNQHFNPLVKGTFIDHPLIHNLKGILECDSKSEFEVDEREKLFQAVGSFMEGKKKASLETNI